MSFTALNAHVMESMEAMVWKRLIWQLIPGPLLLTWFNLNPAWIAHGSVITFSLKCGIKLLIDSNNSTAVSLTSGNGLVISSHTL